MNEVRIGIKGMHCANCSGRVTKALQALAPGLLVEVDLAVAEARVAGDPLPSLEELDRTVCGLGFEYTGPAHGPVHGPVHD